MTLHRIVARLGGDLYAAGLRANVPGPGHSPSDRSVSLLLSGGRLVAHGFGGSDWRAVRAQLQAEGLIDRDGHVLLGAGEAGPVAPVRPGRPMRIAAARRIWDGAGAIGAASPSRRHLERRAIPREAGDPRAVRHHPAAPLSAYRPGSAGAPALVAAVRAPSGVLTAVELTYLTPDGRRDDRLRIPRKTVGVVPAGSAVRLAQAAGTLLVGEGVMTVLSAAHRFGLPGWALLAAHNLAAWSPPAGVERVLIAADRGEPGETAARRLQARLRGRGFEVTVAAPSAPFDDWNAAAIAERRREGG